MKLKAYILFFICYGLVSIATSQNNLIKGRYNFKLGYASYPEEEPNGHRIPNYRLQADYGLLKYLEVGIYSGYSRFTCYNLIGGSDYNHHANTLFYGVNLNFNPLTFIIKANDFRFDLYLTAKYGGHYKFIPENYSLPRHMAEYSVGVGAAFYVWKHIGLFAEYNYGYFDYFVTVYSSNQHPTPPSMLRFGLTYKYKRK
jgi:hypothetical protein